MNAMYMWAYLLYVHQSIETHYYTESRILLLWSLWALEYTSPLITQSAPQDLLPVIPLDVSASD